MVTGKACSNLAFSTASLELSAEIDDGIKR